jgi:integrase
MLTDTQIKKAKPGEKRKLYDERGLYLEVRATADGKTSKWWRFKYRFDGKEKLLSLGTYPDVPLAGRWIDEAKRERGDRSGYLKGARDLRDEARELVAQGTDPSQSRKAEKTAARAAVLSTLKAVSEAWLKDRASAWKAGTLDAITSSLENHVYPELGGMPIATIKPADVRRVIKAIEATGASETAGRVFQRLRSIFRYSLAHELLEADPTYALKPAEILKPRKVQHRAALSESEAPEFLRRLEDYEGDVATKAALKLLVLTAVRPGELRGAEWSEVDTESAMWRIPGARMKMQTEHLVPLSTQAIAVLNHIKTVSGDRALVFPSPFYPDKALSENTLNSALARMGYKGIATAHGMRTLFSTCANEAGWNGDLIEKQLAHEERDDVRAAYNRAQHVAERRKLMQWWGDKVDQLRKSAKVRPIKVV